MNFEQMWARAEAGDEEATFALVTAFDEAGRPADALGVLSRAARRGSPNARVMIAVRTILGQVPQLGPDDAVTLIKDSAQRGNARAAEMMAALIGVGYARGSIEDAYDMLERAAQLGSQSARRQIAILGGKAGVVIAAPQVSLLSESPRIGAINQFIDAGICDWLIQHSKPRLRRATVYAPDGVGNRLSGARTNSYAPLTIVDFDFLVALVLRRVALAVGLPVNQIENFSILHYAPGEEFTDHHDFLDPDLPNYRQLIEKLGERILTFLIYLNEDYSGGETAFPQLGINHKGRRGDAMFFYNADAHGKPDKRTLHAGRPPAVGEKWLLSIFMRNRLVIPAASV